MGLYGRLVDRVTIPAIKHSVYIEVLPSRVYETLTTADGWDAWFTTGATVDAKAGGSIQLRWADWGPAHVTTSSDGPVLEATPDVRFVFQWTPARTTTTVAFDLIPTKSGTVIELEETGYTDDPKDLKMLVSCATGWGEALALLKVYLEHGIAYGRPNRVARGKDSR